MSDTFGNNFINQDIKSWSMTEIKTTELDFLKRKLRMYERYSTPKHFGSCNKAHDKKWGCQSSCGLDKELKELRKYEG